MKCVTVILILILNSSVCCGAESPKLLTMNCDDYSWSDVEVLVQPYLDDVLYTSLVMQGQSANYNTSSAALFAMDKSLPDVVKRILRSIIKANC